MSFKAGDPVWIGLHGGFALCKVVSVRTLGEVEWIVAELKLTNDPGARYIRRASECKEAPT